MTRNVQLPYIPIKMFLQTDLFLVEFTANSDIRRNLCEKSQART